MNSVLWTFISKLFDSILNVAHFHLHIFVLGVKVLCTILNFIYLIQPLILSEMSHFGSHLSQRSSGSLPFCKQTI